MAWYDRYRGIEESASSTEDTTLTVEAVHSQQNWPMLAALAVFALAFAVLIALGARAAYHHWHKTSSPAASTTAPAPPPTNLQPSGNKL
jgi:hypothetical protein